MLEARNTTVAPPGRRSTRLTSNAGDGDTSVPPAADAKDNDDGEQRGTARKRQDSPQDNSEQRGTSRKHQDSPQDDGNGDQRQQYKHQDNNSGESTTPFRGWQRERGGHRSQSHSEGIFFFLCACRCIY